MNALITLAHRVLSGPPWAAAAKWISRIAAFSLLAGAPSLQAQEKLFDYGDAPQVYPVMFGQNGARHGVGELRLGTRLDWEQDGQPSSGANADDSLPVGSADDEDGVVFGNALVPGQKVNIRVTVSEKGFLNAWVDFARNGNWSDKEDQIMTDVILAPGDNDLSFEVPTTAAAGTTFARFRFSNAEGLLPIGAAQDGEVEDYAVAIGGMDGALDFGDAPAPYPTTIKDNGARHQLDKGIYLGASVDPEQDGQPSAGADGDDLNPSTAGSDEDGVSFLSALILGQLAEVEVVLTSVTGAQALLDAWIDFNADGDWADAGEQIFGAEPLSPGANILKFSVPREMKPGFSYARFRVSMEGKLPVTGDGGPGEVEDYRVTLGGEQALDFGDATDKYPVTLAQDGARHRIVKGIALGRLVDPEQDGQPSSASEGDDISPAGAGDDEDGIRFLAPLVPGRSVIVEVTSTTAEVRLDAWIDWNRNADWNDPGDQIFVGTVLNAGANNLVFTVPEGTSEGETFSRWRISFRGGLKPGGPAPEGEVEDHLVKINREDLDFGDAPQSYPVMLSQDGARHIPLVRYSLGPLLDAERDGQPSINADGDDLTPTPSADDEDGVTFLTPIQPGAAAQVEVIMNTGEGLLDAWMDFNRNGTWEHPAEQIFLSRVIVDGPNLLTFNVPANAVPGLTFARFRMSREGKLTPTGLAASGEVEDHPTFIREAQQPCLPRTNKGTNFWLAFPGNYAPDPDNPVRLRLCIVGPRTTTGTVQIPGLNWSNNFTIGAEREVTITLPPAVELDSVLDTVIYRGINVTASQEVAVFGLNRVKYTTDGFLGLPTDVVGRRYVIQSYGNEFTGVPDLNGTQFALVATVDNTKVSIVPSITTFGRTAGVPYTITLPRAGDCYQLRNTNDFTADLSGTVINADKPISAFGSHQCAAIPSDDHFFCDYLVEQLLPVERAGTSFVTMPLATRSSDTFRFTAVQDDTAISINGVVVATIDAGKFHEQSVGVAAHITSSKPILTVQYANSSDADGVVNSDPFMLVVPHVNMFLNNYIVCTPHTVATGLAFAENYISVVAPNAVVGSVTLDGAAIPAASFTAIGASGFSGARIKVNTTGFHSLAANLPFGVSLYGWAEYDSYGFPGGMSFGDTTPPQITCPADFTVVLTATGTAAPPCAAPVPDLRANLQIRDDCGLPERVVVVQNPQPGTMVGPGQHIITLSTVDAAGNVGFCQTVMTVIDPSPIELICPQTITATCNEEGGAYVDFKVVARQRCGDSAIPVKSEPPSGSFFPTGETLVKSMVEDAEGNTYSCEFFVVVACDEPKIVVTHTPGTITLNWSGITAVLERALTVSGPWSVVPDAQDTYTLNPSDNEKGFFRLRLTE